MCGRYLVEIDEEELNEMVAAAEKNVHIHSEQISYAFKGGEIFPGNLAPVIMANNEVRFMTWGFPSINPNKPSHINARSETAAASKTFGDAMKTRRCTIPASGYFEWITQNKKHRIKYKFTLPGRSLMYMAGIYSIDYQFVVLTRDAAPSISEIHDRMPVILPKSIIDMWLRGSPEALKEALNDLHFSPVYKSDIQPKQMNLFS